MAFIRNKLILLIKKENPIYGQALKCDKEKFTTHRFVTHSQNNTIWFTEIDYLFFGCVIDHDIRKKFTRVDLNLDSAKDAILSEILRILDITNTHDISFEYDSSKRYDKNIRVNGHISNRIDQCANTGIVDIRLCDYQLYLCITVIRININDKEIISKEHINDILKNHWTFALLFNKFREYEKYLIQKYKFYYDIGDIGSCLYPYLVMIKNSDVHIFSNDLYYDFLDRETFEKYCNNFPLKNPIDPNNRFLIATYANILNVYHLDTTKTDNEMYVILIQIAINKYVYISTTTYEFTIPKSEQISHLLFLSNLETRPVMAYSKNYQYNMDTLKYQLCNTNNIQYCDFANVEHVAKYI